MSMCLCVCVCLCVCLGYNFWMSWHRSFILAWCYILTKSRSSFSIKIKMLILLPGLQTNLVWLVQGQCHPRSIVSLTFYWQVGGGPSTESHSSLKNCVHQSNHNSTLTLQIDKRIQYTLTFKVFGSYYYFVWKQNLSFNENVSPAEAIHFESNQAWWANSHWLIDIMS